MTTLVDERGALVVRCDECRRLWPVTRERLEAVWELDDARDTHRCPVCIRPLRGPVYEPGTHTGASGAGEEHDLSDAP